MEWIILSLFLSAFFSGAEIAFVSSDKLKIEIARQKGTLTGRILAGFVERPGRFIGTMLVGNNIALVIFSMLMAGLLTADNFQIFALPEGTLMLIQTLITTIIVLIFGEFLPKVLFRINPDGILRFLAIPLKAMYFTLYAITMVFTSISRWIIQRILKKEYNVEKQEFGRIDLEHFIGNATTIVDELTSLEDELNTEIFGKALYLQDVKIRECMIPRTEIEALDISEGIESLREKFISTNLSRILIYEGDIDNVLGYTHHLSMFRDPKNIRSILFDIPVVPETTTAGNVLNLFKWKRRSIAKVVDEYGGTSGIVTMEDVIEEIFGEIHDEHDTDEFIEKRLTKDEFIFSARIEIDYVNEKYDLNLPKGDFETLGGLILAEFEDIPEKEEVLRIDRFEITILKRTDTHIETIRLKYLSPEAEDQV